MEAVPASRAAEPSAAAPIVLKTVVPCAPLDAFDYFTRDIGRWWPLARYSCGEADAQDVAFEPRLGGRLVETTRDGGTHVWGTVSHWIRGERVAFSWHPGGDPSRAMRVDVAFAANPGGTLVTLTHDGFEALGERAPAVRQRYRSGWPTVFGQCYPDHCAQRAREPQ
jgi:hypothetical protein